jgi:hypothetical protein
MNGIVYIAIGNKHLEMAIASAKSIINTSSRAQNITILTDCQDRSIAGMSIENISTFIRALRFKPAEELVAYLKTRLCDLTPYHRTLYLDNDTLAIADLSDVWQYCGKWIGVVPAYNPILSDVDYGDDLEIAKTKDCLATIGDYRQYNTGIFLFTKYHHVEKFFDLWHEEWKNFERFENMAFNRLVTYGMPVDYLPNVYNEFYPNRNSDSKLIHYIGGHKKHLNN